MSEAALRESDLLAVFQALPDSYLVLDAELRVTAASDAYLQATRRSRGDVVDRHVSELFSGETAADALRQTIASIERARRQEATDTVDRLRCDVPRRTSEGGGFETRYWRQSNTPVIPPGNRSAHIIHRVEDITRAVLAEHAHSAADAYAVACREPRAPCCWSNAPAAEALYRINAHLGNSPLGIVEFDPDFRVMRWSETAVHLFGWSAAEMVGKAIAEIRWVHEDDMETVARVWAEMMTGSRPRSRVCNRNYHKDGSVVHCEWYNSAIYDDAGNLVSIFSQVLDVTAQKRAEQALRESKNHLRQMIDSLPGMVWTATSDGTVDFVSQQWIDYTGATADSPRTRNHLCAAIHPDDRDYIVQQWGEAVARQRPALLECRLRQYDGSYRWFRSRVTPFHDRDGCVLRWLGIVTDIDDLKRTQQALLASQEELTEAHRLARLGTWYWDLRTDALQLSESVREICGRDVPPFPAQRGTLLPEASWERVNAAVSAALQTGRGYDLEIEVIHGHGHAMWVHIKCEPVRDETGTVVALRGTVQDISEREEAEARIREKEAYFRQFTEILPQLVWSCTREGLNDYASPQWLHYVGWSLEACLGEGWLDAIHPEDRPRMVRAWQAAVASGEQYEDEYRMRRHDGEYRWFRARGTPLRDEQGRIVKWFGVNTDIHDLRQLTEALRLTNERFAAALASAPVVVFNQDLDLRYTWIHNPAHGHTVQSMLGRCDRDIVEREEDAERLESIKREAIAGGRTVRCEITLAHAGDLYTYDVVVRPQYDETGRTVGITCAAIDVTERKLSQARLALHTKRQTLLLHIASDIFHAWCDKAQMSRLVYDRLRDHLQVDASFTYRLGKGQKELELVAACGIPAGRTGGLQRLQIGQAFCGMAAASGTAIVADAARIASDEAGAGVRALGMRAYMVHPLFSLSGEVIGTLSFGSTRRDHFADDEVDLLQTVAYFLSLAWERRRIEDEVKQLNAELERRVEERTAALVRSNQELQRFAYVAAHDLQTPLRSIASFTQLLNLRLTDRLDDESARYLRYIADNAQRMQLLIRDLLTYARLDADGRPFQHIDMRGLVDEVLASLAAAIAEKKAQIHCGELPALAVDRTQLAQVLMNLIENAIKYNDSEAVRIDISARQEAAEWVFAVRDNGIGIDPRYQEQIFAPFKRLHPYHIYPGSGVGLAICRHIVECHSGRLWVESTAGEGSTFFFTLPATPQVAQ